MSADPSGLAEIVGRWEAHYGLRGVQLRATCWPDPPNKGLNLGRSWWPDDPWPTDGLVEVHPDPNPLPMIRPFRWLPVGKVTCQAKVIVNGEPWQCQEAAGHEGSHRMTSTMP